MSRKLEYSDLSTAQLQRTLKAAEELAAKQLNKIRKLERKANSLGRRLAKCEEQLQAGQGGEDDK